MTSRDFCYWLQGVFEVADPTTLNERATAQIKAHLAMVFVHEIDPSMGDDEHQKLLNEVHESGTPEHSKPPPPQYGYTSGKPTTRC